MKLTKERIEYLRPLLKDADYCQLAKWGKDGVDVQVDLMDAIDDIAELETVIEYLEDSPQGRMYQELQRLRKLAEYWEGEYNCAKIRLDELKAEIKRLREGIKLASRIKDHGFRCERLDDLLKKDKCRIIVN
jgi:hypothetical protein